jgi:hypothetical protein
MAIRKKKGMSTMFKFLIPVALLVVGVIFSDKIKPMLSKIPLIGKMIDPSTPDSSPDE